MYEDKYIRASITILKKDKKWLDDKCISLSKFIKQKIKEERE